MQGHVRKRGKKWCFVLDVGRDPATGKRKQKWFSGYKTKKEAQRAMAEKLAEVNRGDYIEPAQMKFKDLAWLWLDEYVKTKCQPKTYEDYERIIRNHVEKEEIGGKMLDQLKPVLFQRLYNRKHDEGLSPSYVQSIHCVCLGSLKWAVKMQMIQKNPAEQATPPKRMRRQMKYWTREQVEQFFEYAKDHIHFPVFYLAFFTGMRRGELVALHWEDVDLESGRISVHRSSFRVKGQGLKIQDTTKTAAGRRVIEISPGVVSTLKKHKAKQAAHLMQIGQAPKFVFCTANGTPVEPTDLGQYFRRLIKRAGLPQIRFHDIRHTHATLLLQQGVHPKIVQERLGHSSITMTLDTYSHVIPSMQKDAANMLENLFTNSNANNHKTLRKGL